MEIKRAEPQTFDPRAPEYRFRLWLKVGTLAGAGRYHFFWRRIALAALAGMVAAWLLVAAGVWSFLRYGREWQDAGYWEVALIPVRPTVFRASLGRFYTAKGLAEMNRRNFWTARDYLLAGLRHAPADLAVRRTVAICLVQFGLLPRALDVLADGAKRTVHIKRVHLQEDAGKLVHPAKENYTHKRCQSFCKKEGVQHIFDAHGKKNGQHC